MTDTTLSSWALVLWRTLESYHLEPAPLFREAGLDATQLHNAGARFRLDHLQRLWRLALQATGDPCFGLRTVEFCHPTTFHALGYAWMASATLGDALQRLIRHARLLSSALEPRLVESGVCCELLYQGRTPVRPADLVPASVDAGLAALVDLCRAIAGESFSPQEVRVVSAEPQCRERYYRLFRCPVVFASTQPGIVFDACALKRPLPTANADLARASEQAIIEYLARFDRTSVAMMVRAKLIEQLPRGDATEESVAQALNLSASSLKRRLRTEGTSYREILNNMRRELADHYIASSQLSINEITYMLGFAEPANFTRAFRRWKGASPSEYRRARSGAIPP